MRIIVEPNKFTYLDELKPGDVFNYAGVWYIKIDIIPFESSYLNAVNLATGIPVYIAPYSEVKYQDVELRVKEF